MDKQLEYTKEFTDSDGNKYVGDAWQFIDEKTKELVRGYFIKTAPKKDS